jgi:hypothetical protein
LRKLRNASLVCCFSHIDYRADVNTLEQHPIDAPIMNDFTRVAWKTQHPLAIGEVNIKH